MSKNPREVKSVAARSNPTNNRSMEYLYTRYVAMRSDSVNVVSWLYAHSGQMEGGTERRDT